MIVFLTHGLNYFAKVTLSAFVGVFCCACSLLSENGSEVYPVVESKNDWGMDHDNEFNPLPVSPTEFSRSSAKTTLTTDFDSNPLQLLYDAGDFDNLLEESQNLALVAESGSSELEASTFFGGVSQYYLGDHQASKIFFDQHGSNFPFSIYSERAQYYSASNLVKMSRWRSGGLALDAFIENFPESNYVPRALYDRASVDYASENFEDCLNRITQLEQAYSDSTLVLRVYLLKGYALKKIGDMAQAEAAFLVAKNTADPVRDADVVARALRNLIEVSAEQRRWQDSKSYYDLFMANYAQSSQAPLAVAESLRVMEQMGKINVGLDRLERILLKMPEGTSVKNLNLALRSYAAFFQRLYGPKELIKRLGNLYGEWSGIDQLREALIVAQVEALETFFPQRKQEIRVYYSEIISAFDARSLATPTVLKVASYFLKIDPHVAGEWYREAFHRGEGRYESQAVLGLAHTDALSDNSSRLKLAVLGFRQVLEVYGSPEFREESNVGLSKLSENHESLVKSLEDLRGSSQLLEGYGLRKRRVTKTRVKSSDRVTDPKLTSYKIKKGDTLWEISRSFGTSVFILQQLNGIQGAVIREGDKIKVPVS